MIAIAILYIAVLISTHQSLAESLTSLLILFIHDFTQHVVISSHRCDTLIMETVRNRAFITAIAGVELYILNLCIVGMVFYAPLEFCYEQMSMEYGISFERPFPKVLTAFLKTYEYSSISGGEILISFLSSIPMALTHVCMYWVAGVSYSHMTLRKRFHGYGGDSLCMDDIVVNSLVMTIALLTGQRILRMIISVLPQKVFDSTVGVYHGSSTNMLRTSLVTLYMTVYELFCGLFSQVIMSLAVVNRDIFGKDSMKRAIVKVFGVELMFGLLRSGVLADWGSMSYNAVFGTSGILFLYCVGRFAYREYEDVRNVEERRERALRGL